MIDILVQSMRGELQSGIYIPDFCDVNGGVFVDGTGRIS